MLLNVIKMSLKTGETSTQRSTKRPGEDMEPLTSELLRLILPCLR